MQAWRRIVGNYWLLAVIILAGLFLRLLAVARFDFIADNGTEFYVLEQMKTGTCWPLLGPLLGVEQVYIPPTYFYILYAIDYLAHTPPQMVWFFAISNSLAILFLSLAVQTVTNKKTGIMVALVAQCSFAFFMEGTYIWHPQPVSMLFTLGLWLLLLAHKKNNLVIMSLGIASYLLSLSVHPSPLPFLPYFFLQTVVFFWKKQRQHVFRSCLYTVAIFICIGVPIYASQLFFELKNGFPTLTTIFINPDLTQPAYISSAVKYENFYAIIRYFVSRNIGISGTFTNTGVELIIWLIMIGVLSTVSLRHMSWRWPSLFPYSLIVALLVLLQFHDRELLFWSANHRYMPTLLFLFFALADTWYRVESSKLGRGIIVAILILFLTQNGQAFFQKWAQLQRPIVTESYEYKQHIVSTLQNLLQSNNYNRASTLLLHKNFAAANYADHVTMQYYAMEYWTLGNYDFLVPPINSTCNQFDFFTKEQINQQAKQIVLVERTSNQLPRLLFHHFVVSRSWKLDDQTMLVLYEASACYP